MKSDGKGMEMGKWEVLGLSGPLLHFIVNDYMVLKLCESSR